MASDDLDEAEVAIYEGIAPVVFKIAKWDADPIRDCRLITRAVLSALASSGFKIIRDNT